MTIYPKSIKGSVFAIIRIFVAISLLVTIALLFFQERLIFFPTHLAPTYQFNFEQPFEEQWLNLGGLKINSLLFKAHDVNHPTPHDAKRVILYFHGNAGSLEDWGEVAEELSEKTKWDVWIVDFPGYGKSEGTISSESQLHEMAKALWTNVMRHYASDKVIIFGRSIGTGLAVKLASEHNPSGLILESPYFSLSALAHQRFSWLPISLLRYTFRSDLWLPNVKCPIFIVHGTNDEVIPFSQGQMLSLLAPGAEFAAIQGGHHNDLGMHEEYWQPLLSWIETQSQHSLPAAPSIGP